MKKGRILSGIAIILVGIGLTLDGFSKMRDAVGANKEELEPTVMNEWVSDKNGVAFQVTSVENTQTVGSGFTEVTTDNNFVVLSISIDNESTDPYDVNSLRFILTEGDKEYEYSGDTVLSLEDMMYMDTLNPGITKNYVIVYETPTTTDEAEYTLKVKPVEFSEKGSVYITLKEG